MAGSLFRPDDSPGRVNGGLKHSQVRGLIGDGVLANDWAGFGFRLQRTSSNPLCDFLTDVYAAWDRLQARTGMARSIPEMRRVG